VAHHVEFLTKHFGVGLVETIQFRICGHGEVVVKHAVESINGVARHFLIGLVPTLDYLVGVPTFGIVERWSDVDVFQKVERSRDGHRMLHAVFPILEQRRMQQFVFFRGDGVGQGSRVVHADFLIPSLLAHRMLTLERIEAG